MTSSHRKWLKGIALALALLSSACAGSQPYPHKPVTLVVPFPAGGPTDKLARELAEAMRLPLGQPLQIVNVSGGGGTIAVARVASAPPDGYTLLITHIQLATSSVLTPELPYKPLEDLEYAGLIKEAPMALVGGPSVPARDFAQLRQWLRSGKALPHIAHAGVGTASHVCALLLTKALGMNVLAVPYRGTAPALSDLVEGQVDLLCDQTSNTVAHIAGGRIRAFAVTSALRVPLPALEGVPTLEESGLSNFNLTIWHGLYAPKGTPQAVLEKINFALRQALHDPAFVQQQKAYGSAIVRDGRLNPVEHKAFVASEIQKWTRIVDTAGLRRK